MSFDKFEKQFLAYGGNSDLWKFEKLEGSKRHRIRKKNYRRYLNGLMKENYGVNTKSLTFNQLGRFISVCNSRFAIENSYSKKPSKSELSKASYDAIFRKMTW